MNDDKKTIFMLELKKRTESVMYKETIEENDLDELCFWIQTEFDKLYSKKENVNDIRGILAILGAADMAKEIEDTETRKVILSRGLERLKKQLEELEEEE